MEKITKHRILGCCVLIGLAILLYPLFQKGEDLSSQETAMLKAPPFPDPVTQMTTKADDSIPAEPLPLNPANDVSHVAENLNQEKPIADNITPADKTNQEINTTTINNKDNQNNESDVSVTPGTKSNTSKPQMIKKAIHIIKQNPSHKIAVTKIKHANKIKFEPIDNNGLIKLKNAAWVIRMGSFKNKEHALRLVNRLRANGYAAFIQETNTALGDTTRGYVGRESK